jgi:hypothetical protein
MLINTDLQKTKLFGEVTLKQTCFKNIFLFILYTIWDVSSLVFLLHMMYNFNPSKSTYLNRGHKGVGEMSDRPGPHARWFPRASNVYRTHDR